MRGYSNEDIAAGIQSLTEDLVTSYIADSIKKFSTSNKCNILLAGGLFANVKLNQRINDLINVNSLYIFPNMGDGGLGLGAALAHLQKQVTFDDVYLGKNFQDTDIEKILRAKGLPFIRSNNISRDIAIAINDNKIVARYAGRMEYGPRSLGNRSILYSPKDRTINKWLNEKLNRTEFMPFAPVIRDIDIDKFFLVKEKSSCFSFMTLACNVTEYCKEVAPAIVHVDDTARPQVITKELNPAYYEIITEYDSLTDSGILVNTSFNLHEEPIFNTPEEAIDTFLTAGLDYLAIENFIVQKRN